MTERGVAVAQACRELELCGERAAAVDARAGRMLRSVRSPGTVSPSAEQAEIVSLEEGGRPSQGGA